LLVEAAVDVERSLGPGVVLVSPQDAEGLRSLRRLEDDRVPLLLAVQAEEVVRGDAAATRRELGQRSPRDESRAAALLLQAGVAVEIDRVDHHVVPAERMDSGADAVGGVDVRVRLEQGRN